MPLLLLVLLHLCSPARAEEDGGDLPSDEANEAVDDEADEIIEVWGVREARARVEHRLSRLGYSRQKRGDGKTVYRNRQRWKPAVVVFDDGYVMVRDPVVRGRVGVYGPFVMVHGMAVSKRKIERVKGEVLEEVDPFVRDWQEALRSEIAADGDYVAPADEVPPTRWDDYARQYVGTLTGQEPWDLERSAFWEAIAGESDLPPVEDEAMRDWRAVLTMLRARGDIHLTVLQAMALAPRYPHLEQERWEQADTRGALELDEGYLAGIVSLAWQLTVAAPREGERVLELGREVGWRRSVLEALGTEVSQDPEDLGPFDLIVVDQGTTEVDRLTPALAPSGRIVEVGSGKLWEHKDGGVREILMMP